MSKMMSNNTYQNSYLRSLIRIVTSHFRRDENVIPSRQHRVEQGYQVRIDACEEKKKQKHGQEFVQLKSQSSKEKRSFELV
jgi:hypothetical protein